jgi:hypothetical protein
MDRDPGEGIYRAMIEDQNGMPMLGLAAVKLGVRTGIDIVPDPKGMVYRPLFKAGDANGLSCAPSIKDLPAFALPVEWGGTNTKTVVWRIEEFDLGPTLMAQEDTAPQSKGRHISVGPSTTMSFDDYFRTIQGTRPRWKKVTKI